MNRSKDLDTIAPDDLIIEAKEESIPTVTPIIEKETKDFKPEIKIIKKIQFKDKIYDILGHTKSPLSSFIVNPETFDFSERNEDESILLAIRPHWVTNFSWILISIAMLFIPSILRFLNVLESLPFNYQFVSILFWYLITFIYVFEKFLSWYFNVFIVTNKRLVDIDFNNMLNKHFAEADINMIQDTSSSVKGIFGTFFNYGTVLIQTASEINQIVFEDVPNPSKVIKVLQEIREVSEL
ncbi:MAG: hypothetical protein WC895_01980 [Candidatus Shapirobacteria bacterium]|jgi:hypothetical protein